MDDKNDTRNVRKRPIEPLLWTLFSAGGMVAALVLPALVLFNGLAVGFGWIEPLSYESIRQFVAFPVSRALMFIVLSLSLFHWGHRFRYTLYDGLQLKHLNELISVTCYGSAVLGTIAAGYLLLTVNGSP